MSNQQEKIHHGILTDEEEEVSLTQLCNLCGQAREEIMDLVNEGILEPKGSSHREWRFSYVSVHRVHKVRRLRKDFDLNLSGAGLVLHLLDRIEELENKLKSRKF